MTTCEQKQTAKALAFHGIDIRTKAREPLFDCRIQAFSGTFGTTLTLQGVPKKRIPSFIFGITLVI